MTVCRKVRKSCEDVSVRFLKYYDSFYGIDYKSPVRKIFFVQRNLFDRYHGHVVEKLKISNI